MAFAFGDWGSALTGLRFHVAMRSLLSIDMQVRARPPRFSSDCLLSSPSPLAPFWSSLLVHLFHSFHDARSLLFIGPQTHLDHNWKPQLLLLYTLREVEQHEQLEPSSNPPRAFLEPSSKLPRACSEPSSGCGVYSTGRAARGRAGGAAGRGRRRRGAHTRAYVRR